MDLFGIVDLIHIREEEQRQRDAGILSEREREIRDIEQQEENKEHPVTLNTDNVYCGITVNADENELAYDISSCLLPPG